MLRPAPYLSKKLTHPLPTKDGGVPCTVKDARTYMMALSKHRERQARNGNARPQCCWSRLMSPISAARSSSRYSMTARLTWPHSPSPHENANDFTFRNGTFNFDPEARRVMGVAFEMARVANEMIAKRITELAKAGERNPDLLCESAVKEFRERLQTSGLTQGSRRREHSAACPGGALVYPAPQAMKGSRDPAFGKRAGFSSGEHSFPLSETGPTVL
jgi:hypothetical protein